MINTQRMLCSNQQMIRQCFAVPGRRAAGAGRLAAVEPHLRRQPQRRHHALQRRHALHRRRQADAGAIGETLRNLREIAPTIYFNVPKGFEEIANALEVDDAAARDAASAACRMFFFAGAGLSQPVWDKLDARRRGAPAASASAMLTGLGMTETAPFAICANAHDVKSGHIGLPAPGVEVKLVPMGDKTEVRYRGPNVTPGYWRAPEQTAESFDDEGFYCSGDAVKPMDPARPGARLRVRRPHRRGLQARRPAPSSGRPAAREDHRRRRPAACRTSCRRPQPRRDRPPGLPAPRRLPRAAPACGADAPARERAAPRRAVRAFFQHLRRPPLARPAPAARPGSRARCVLAEPPSIDRGEITDKGSINQRAVLTHRAALVERAVRRRRPDVIRPR